MAYYEGTGFNEKQEAACEKLIGICNQYDGTENQFYLNNLFNHYLEMPAFFWCEEAGEVVGLICIYGDNEEVVELSGCVHPNYRGQGIFTELLKEALKKLKTFGYKELLFVTNPKVVAGYDYVAKRSQKVTKAQTEYFMKQNVIANLPKTDANTAIHITLPEEIDLLTEIHGRTPEEAEVSRQYLENSYKSSAIFLFTITYENKIVGTMAVDTSGEYGHIFGLVIVEDFRGKGIGKEAMEQVAEWIQKETGQKLTLAVESENKPALALYQKLGFEIENTETYYKVLCCDFSI